jgi:hypothetical protein
MSDRWKHDNFHKNPQQPEEHCPYCRIRELEAEVARLEKSVTFWSGAAGESVLREVAQRERAEAAEAEVVRLRMAGAIGSLIDENASLIVRAEAAEEEVARLTPRRGLAADFRRRWMEAEDRLAMIANYPDPDFPADDTAEEVKRAWRIIYVLKGIAAGELAVLLKEQSDE